MYFKWIDLTLIKSVRYIPMFAVRVMTFGLKFPSISLPLQCIPHPPVVDRDLPKRLDSRGAHLLFSASSSSLSSNTQLHLQDTLSSMPPVGHGLSPVECQRSPIWSWPCWQDETVRPFLCCSTWSGAEIWERYLECQLCVFTVLSKQTKILTFRFSISNLRILDELSNGIHKITGILHYDISTSALPWSRIPYTGHTMAWESCELKMHNTHQLSSSSWLEPPYSTGGQS